MLLDPREGASCVKRDNISHNKPFDKKSASHAETRLPGQEAFIGSIIQRLDRVCCFSIGEPLGCETSFSMK